MNIEKEITRLTYFIGEEMIVAVRVFTSKGILEGYFDNVRELYTQTHKYNKKGFPAYITINPVENNFVIDKPRNQLIGVKKAVKDKNISYLSKVMIDFDQVIHPQLMKKKRKQRRSQNK